MPVDGLMPVGPGQLVQLLEHRIRARTRRRIRRLEVHPGRDGLYVRGEVPTYHVKQLAVEAIREVLDMTDGVPVRMEIQVL